MLQLIITRIMDNSNCRAVHFYFRLFSDILRFYTHVRHLSIDVGYFRFKAPQVVKLQSKLDVTIAFLGISLSIALGFGIYILTLIKG